MSDYSRGVCSGRRIAYVLDAAGFFASIQLSLPEVFTVKEVIEEVKDRDSSVRLDYSLAAGKVTVVEPEEEHINIVKKVAEELGELGRLSVTDIKLLALVSSLLKSYDEVVVVSDDRSLQNVALRIGAKVMGVKRPPLKRPRKYVYQCKLCGFTSSTPGTCPRCGAELQRVRR